MEIETQEIHQEYNELMTRLAPNFANESGFTNARKYIQGLLGPAERKNGWQMAEQVGDATPYAMQQFIYRGRYSADALRDEGRAYTVEHIGELDGVMVLDETGFLKKGDKSCGVSRQYTGTAGKIENCQIGVFLSYASSKGHSPIDRRLYIPESWIHDSRRLREAGVPEGTEFRTKPQLGLQMVKEATAAGVPYKWLTGDCVYGDSRIIRSWMERNGKSYVLCVSRKEHIDDGNRYGSVGDILKGLPEDGWFEASSGTGTKDLRIYDWFLMEMPPPREEGFKRCLLVRRSKTDKNDLQAHLCFAPAETSKCELVKVAGTRWTVEMCFQESKSIVGMDQYEVRSYNGWYRHITFACIALALLTVLSSQSMDEKSFQEHDPRGQNLETFKKGLFLHG